MGWGVGLEGHQCGPKRFGTKSMGFQVGFWGHTVMVGLEGHQSGPKRFGEQSYGVGVRFWGMGLLEWGWGSMGGQGWVKKAEMWA